MSIFFLELDGYSVLPMLWYRLTGHKVYFLECTGSWRKQRVLRWLSKIGVVWLSHQEFELDQPGRIEHDLNVDLMRIGERLCASESYQTLVSSMKTCVYQLVRSDIPRMVELLHCTRINDSDPSIRDANVWIPNTVISRSLLEAYSGVVNRCPRVWTAIELFLRVVARGIRRAPLVARRVKARRSHGGGGALVSPGDRKRDLREYEIAYFPHVGVMYGDNLFLKDQFYSSDPASPFFAEKIVHFEVLDSKYISAGSWEYYRLNNIHNKDWRQVPLKNAAAAHAVLGFVARAIRRRMKGMDADLLLKFARLVWAVKADQARLRNLSKLRLMLIGYDTQFPQTLAVACKLQGVQLVAVQERMLASWLAPPMLIDDYFVIGPEALDRLKSIAQTPTTFHQLGPIRLKDHARAEVPGLVTKLRESYSWLVLALDFHSEVGWFENGRSSINNWRTNAIFYDHILRLCANFPEAYFLLKGKNTDFMGLPYFKDVVRRMRAQPNLLILEDQGEWTPFSSVASTDIAVARATSLADEMLALGKPIILDDYDGFPSERFDYGPDVIAYSYDSIREKLSRFFADPEGYNLKLDDLRRRLYSVSDPPVDATLQREMMAIWDATEARAA